MLYTKERMALMEFWSQIYKKYIKLSRLDVLMWDLVFAKSHICVTMGRVDLKIVKKVTLNLKLDRSKK